MRRFAVLTASAVAVALVPIAALGGAPAIANGGAKPSANGGTHPSANGGANSSAEGGAKPSACPERARAALALPPNAVAKAAEAALRQAPRHFKAIDLTGAKITKSQLARFEGAFVRRQCGERVADRTVIVSLLFPKMLPSAALSQGTVFVSRFQQGYVVWEVSPIS